MLPSSYAASTSAVFYPIPPTPLRSNDANPDSDLQFLPLDIVPPLTIAPPVSPVPTASITPPPVREQPVLGVVFFGVVVDCKLHLLKVSCCPRTNTETRRLLPVQRHSASYMAKEDRSQRRCPPRNIKGTEIWCFCTHKHGTSKPNSATNPEAVPVHAKTPSGNG
jgi:hypothetical protein